MNLNIPGACGGAALPGEGETVAIVFSIQNHVMTRVCATYDGRAGTITLCCESCLTIIFRMFTINMASHLYTGPPAARVSISRIHCGGLTQLECVKVESDLTDV